MNFTTSNVAWTENTNLKVPFHCSSSSTNMFQSNLENILGSWPAYITETQTFCLSCVTTPHETQTCGSSLNHSRSPDNSCLGQTGHVTERLSHRVSMVMLWEVCACMCMFAHLYTVCDQSVNSCGLGESTRWGKKKNLSERERELMKGAPDQVPSLWRPPTSIGAIM